MRMKRVTLFVLIFASCFCSQGPKTEKATADLILINGIVYTMEENQSWAAPTPPCTALETYFFGDIISKACLFCKLSQGINKKVPGRRRQNLYHPLPIGNNRNLVR